MCNCEFCQQVREQHRRECACQPEPDDQTVTVVVGSEPRVWQHYSAPETMGEEPAEVVEEFTIEFEEDPEMEEQRKAALQALQFELVKQHISPALYLVLKFLVEYL